MRQRGGLIGNVIDVKTNGVRESLCRSTCVLGEVYITEQQSRIPPSKILHSDL